MKPIVPALAIAIAIAAPTARTLAAVADGASSPAAKNAACDAKTAEKKLNGAAKNSFVKKCVADATRA